MPDSYGRPLCTSPRLRCETSQAAPNVRNANEPAAKANPMTYQIPVKAILAERLRCAGRSIVGRRRPQRRDAGLLMTEAFATNRHETAVARRHSTDPTLGSPRAPDPL